MKKYKLLGIFAILTLFALNSCNKFLDVVPDNVATLDNAFTRRIEAQKYLFTCYSYMPKHGSIDDDPGLLAGDELWRFPTIKGFMEVARGFQSTVSPYGDRWAQYFRAIRDCNIFLENIEKVPDLEETERLRWISEVKFLKSYYHFYLLKMYGPIPVIKKNIAIDANEEDIFISRSPADSVFSYITQLIDESTENLPLSIENPVQELGRITKPIALALKAEVLVYAASPLFNGNADASGLKNPDGTPLFNASYVKEKWDSAAAACAKAIDICHQAGFRLYKYSTDFQQYNLTDTIKTQLSIRNCISERWNSEIIWANTQTSSTSLQTLMSTWWDPANLDISITHGELSPTLKIAEMFYTDKGVPISEDKTWSYNKRYSLRTAATEDQLYIRKGSTTAYLHFNREPRFYADLAFDGAVWYGQGRYDDKVPSNLFFLEGKFKQRNGYGKIGFGTVTGYFIKKLIHFQNVVGTGNNYAVTPYPFTIMRLADLYLLYAEALNEAEGPKAEVYEYINLVRERAGLESVESSWDNYSNNPSKYKNTEGLREIIHTERLIELAFEGKRFWDLRRWKKAEIELNRPVAGWDLMQKDAASFYRPLLIYNQIFGSKDYFWPIAESTVARNKNLVQNLGW